MKMKKLILTLALLFIGLTINAQCLPDGYAFKTQMEIDSFSVNYPGCTEILGDVVINGPDITNLTGFQILTRFGGNLVIYNNLNLMNLDGLINVTTIEGDLQIKNNTTLVTLIGLSGLDSIGKNISMNNNHLTSLIGLQNLDFIGGDIDISFNLYLNNLQGLDNLSSINGDLTIIGNDNLLGLAGFDSLSVIGGNLKIFDNQALKSIVGMNNLDSIGRALWVYHNQNLTDFQGLENLRYVNFIKLEQNKSLKTLEALENIDPLYLDSLFIWKNRSLSTCAVSSICGYLDIHLGTTFEDYYGDGYYIADNSYGCMYGNDIRYICHISLIEIDINKLKIYPNPVKEQLIISNKNIIKMDNIHIYDLIGREMLNDIDIKQEYILNISNYSPGIYFLNINFENQQIVNNIIIKI
jgi:hypothetical protein